MSTVAWQISASQDAINDQARSRALAAVATLEVEPTGIVNYRAGEQVLVIGGDRELAGFAPDKPLTMVLNHADGTNDSIILNHTYNESQIDWFRAGSALNLIKEKEVK